LTNPTSAAWIAKCERRTLTTTLVAFGVKTQEGNELLAVGGDMGDSPIISSDFYSENFPFSD
jgi:hypothetical protein